MGWLDLLGLGPSGPVYPPGPRAEPEVEIPTGTDTTRGARLFKLKCAQCHTISSEGINKQGPCLFNVLGRLSGTIPDFEYTDANKQSEITWSEKHLFKYIENPRRYIPGTRMAFLGIKDEQDRADLIAFIKDNCPNKNGGHHVTAPTPTPVVCESSTGSVGTGTGSVNDGPRPVVGVAGGAPVAARAAQQQQRSPFVCEHGGSTTSSSQTKTTGGENPGAVVAIDVAPRTASGADAVSQMEDSIQRNCRMAAQNVQEDSFVKKSGNPSTIQVC
ncbi:unnamed protein product [Amoebophrya sp. A120]|nr:unnamed protein product [Amoebophrya sp. A120]|eukprot:GSA120T00010494001.1